MKTTQNTTTDNAINHCTSSRWTRTFGFLAAAGILASSAALSEAAPPKMQSSMEEMTLEEMTLEEMIDTPPLTTSKRKAAAKSAPKAKAPAKASSSTSKKKSSRSKASSPPAKKKSLAKAKLSRQEQLQEEAQKLVASLTTTQKSKLLTLLNEADADSLTAISGVGSTRGNAIVKARPFKGVEEVRTVKGVGSKIFADVVSHGKTLTRRGTTKAPASKSTSSSRKSSKSASVESESAKMK